MKTLYLSRNEYNNYKVVKELAEIVKAHNGAIVSSWRPTLEEKKVICRTTYNKISSLQESNKNYKKLLEEKDLSKEMRQHIENSLQNNLKEIEELEKIKDNEQITTYFDSYLTFYYDGYIYYMQLNENPFFEHYFSKAQCYFDNDKKQYIEEYKHYATKVKIDFYINECFEVLSDEIVKEHAQLLWQVLTSMGESQIVTERHRVQNYFGNGYHYEITKIKNNFNSGHYTKIKF